MPYVERRHAAQAGARWDRDRGCWTHAGASLPAELHPYRPAAYTWPAWIQDDLAGIAGDPSPDPNTGTYELRPDQVEDRDVILNARKHEAGEVLAGSEVGTGKTVTVIAAIKMLPGVRNVLVVCPNPVVPHWRRTLRDMGSGGKRWCVINYEASKRLLAAPESAKRAARTRTKNRRHAHQGMPKQAWDVVVTDESHYLSNPDAQRSAALERIIAGPRGAAPAFVIRMSATAGSNPAQLAYLHRGLAWRCGRKPTSTTSAAEYADWCQEHGMQVTVGRFGRLTWTKNDADLETMRRLLFEGTPRWGFRRVPCGWPEQQRFPVPVSLTPGERALYVEAWEEFVAVMRDLDRQRTRRNDPTPRAAAAARARGLAAQTRYRQKAGRLKAPYTAELAQSFLDKHQQVAISCEFLDTAHAVADTLEAGGTAVARFTGEDPDGREQERIAFQRGRKPAIVFTPTEGFSLHAGEVAVDATDTTRALIVGEPRWSPKKALQVEGRTQRDGENAVAYYAYSEHTVEERVIHAVIDGVRATKKMMGDDAASIDRFATALGVPFLVS